MFDWRRTFFHTVAPGMLGGMSIGDWLWILADNGFRVSPSCWPRAMSTTASALLHTPLRWIEHAAYAGRIRATTVHPPLFILGHHRSGTTHLQTLLSIDCRFATSHLDEASIPHAYMLFKWMFDFNARLLLPKTRWNIDNVRLSGRTVIEDEMILALTTCQSAFLGFVFPHRLEHYERYLTMRDVPAGELAKWKQAFIWHMKKLTLKYQRPLVLRSSPHTSRIPLLLELFPDARFVHIHRHPYEVYQSTAHLIANMSKLVGLQRDDGSKTHESVLRVYRTMYDAYFEHRGLIDEGRIVDVAFADLERDPMGQMRRIYEGLNLPDFAEAEPQLRRYVDSLSGYQRNRFEPLAEDRRAEIAAAWGRCFEAFGYEH